MFPIELIDVKKRFKAVGNSSDKSEDIEILKGVNLSLQEGVSTAIVGKSGSGKSTLLNITGLLDTSSEGKVMIDGQDVSDKKDAFLSNLRNRFFGFIFQANLLLEDFSALENVMMTSLIAGTDAKTAKEKASSLLKDVGLEKRLFNLPSQLSGGEKQRVAICRALMNNPRFILADEPTGSLDESNAKQVEDLLLDLCERNGTGLLLVTHNRDFALRCNNLYELSGGVVKKTE